MDTRRVLSDTEEILHQTRKHWAVFLKAALYFALAVAVLAAKEPLLKATEFPPPEDLKKILPPVISWSVKGVCFTFAVVFGLMAVSKLLGFFSNKVLVTGKRMIQQDVLWGSVTSYDIRGIESVSAQTGLLGTILGYGRVRFIMCSGQKFSIPDLRRPHELERELFGAK